MPCASLLQVLPARDTAGFRQEFIALTFLGSLGMDLSPQAISSGSHLDEPSLLSSYPVSSVCLFFSPFHENFLEQTRYQIVTMIIGQDTRRNVVDDVTIGTGAFRDRTEAFFSGVSEEI